MAFRISHLLKAVYVSALAMAMSSTPAGRVILVMLVAGLISAIVVAGAGLILFEALATIAVARSQADRVRGSILAGTTVVGTSVGVSIVLFVGWEVFVRVA